MLKIYKKYTGGMLPQLANLDNIIDASTRTATVNGSSPSGKTPSGSVTPSTPTASIKSVPVAVAAAAAGSRVGQSTASQARPGPPVQQQTTPNATPPSATPKAKSSNDSTRTSTPSAPSPKKPSLPSLNTSSISPGIVAGSAATAAVAAAAVGTTTAPSGSALTGPVLRKPSQTGPAPAPAQTPQTVRKVSASSPSSTVKAMQARLQAQMDNNTTSPPTIKTSTSQSQLSARPLAQKQISTGAVPQSPTRPQLKTSQTDITPTSTSGLQPSRSRSPLKSGSQSPSKQPMITTQTSKAAEMQNKTKKGIFKASEGLGGAAIVTAGAAVGAATVTAAAAAAAAAAASTAASSATTSGANSILPSPTPNISKSPSPGTYRPFKDENILTTTKSAPSSPNLDAEVTTTPPSTSTPDLFIKGHGKNRSSVHEIRIFARSPNLHPEDNDDDLDDDSEQHASLNEMKDTVSNDLKRVDQSKTHKPRRPSNASTMSRTSKTRRLSMISNASVIEETLDDFNWNGREDVSTLEANITKELFQIEASNLHNVVDLDERLDELDRCLDLAVDECSKIGTTLGFFSVQLGTFGDDISHIENQGQGLQVQTTNQKTLWNELNTLLHTVSLPNEKLQLLKQCTYDTPKDLSLLESSAIDLYRAVQAVRSSSDSNSNNSLGNLKALREKRHIYDQAASELIARTKLYLDTKFKTVVQTGERELATSQSGEDAKIQRIDQHTLSQLYPLSGIILFVKEIDIITYTAMIKSYDLTVRQYYDSAITTFFGKWKRQISALTAKIEPFSHGAGKEPVAGSDQATSLSKLKRSGTIARFKSTSAASGSSAGGVDTNGGRPDLSATTLHDNRGLLSHADRKSIQRALKNIFDDLTSIVIGEQEAVTLLFHQSSFGASDFPTYSKSNPVEARIKSPQAFLKLHIREIDPDYSKAQELSNNIGNIFDNWLDQTSKFIDYYLSKFALGAPGLLTIIELYLQKLESSNQDFLIQVLTRLKDKVGTAWQTFVTRQISNINNTFITSKKREGVIIFVRRFPVFAKSVEEDLKDVVNDDTIDNLPVRKTVDLTYERVSKAIFHNLQRLAKDSGTSATTSTNGGANTTNNSSPSTTHANSSSTNLSLASDFEDKELLNYHVMMIENMNLLMDALPQFENYYLQAIALTAQTNYRKEMDLYIQTVLHRPIGKLLDFVQGVKSIIDKNPNESPSKRHGYSKSAFRKLLATYDAKEVRKGIETLRKRVEKHFSDEDDTTTTNHDRKLVDKVWSAIQAQYSVLYGDLVKIESKYYLELGEPTQIEFTKSGIVSDFSKTYS